LAERFALRDTGIAHVEVARPASWCVTCRRPTCWGSQAVEQRARRHRQQIEVIQSISAGTDQYDKTLLRERGIRLASAAGVNAEAVPNTRWR
jgi:lactate dehydrogenase-like 2-hydroxyacid dehydrogenase